MSEKDFSSMTLTELRTELEKRGMDTEGKKAALITRLELLTMMPVTDEELEAARQVVVEDPSEGQNGVKKEPTEDESMDVDTSKLTGNKLTKQKGKDAQSAFFKYFPTKEEKNHPLVLPPSPVQVDATLKAYFKGRIVNLFPMEITDLSRPEILAEVDKCVHFSMNYYRDNSENWAGRLLLQYKLKEDAEEAKTKLKFSAEINVLGSLSEEEEIKANRLIHKLPSETVNKECLQYVAPLPIDITVQELREVFTGMDDIILIQDEAKAASPGNDPYKDPPCYAFLVYGTRKAMRNAAIQMYDPEEDYKFKNQVCFVSPAVVKEDDILFNVIRRTRRKFFVRTYDQARTSLMDNKFDQGFDKKSNLKHCRYHYNRLLLDEEARRVLRLPMLEPTVKELIPDVSKEIWKEKELKLDKVPAAANSAGRGAGRGARGAVRGSRGTGRGSFQTTSGYQHQPRGRSGYALGAGSKPEKPVIHSKVEYGLPPSVTRANTPHERGYSSATTRTGGGRSEAWGQEDSGMLGARSWGRGRDRGELGSMGGGYDRGLGRADTAGYGQDLYTKEAGYGIGRPPAARQAVYRSQGAFGGQEDYTSGGWGGGYGQDPEPAFSPPRKASKKEGLIRKLSSLLEGLGDDEPPAPALVQGTFGMSSRRGKATGIGDGYGGMGLGSDYGAGREYAQPKYGDGYGGDRYGGDGYGGDGYGGGVYGGGFKRPQSGDGNIGGYKRPRGGLGGGMDYY